MSELFLTTAVFDAALFHYFFPALAAILSCVRYNSLKLERISYTCTSYKVSTIVKLDHFWDDKFLVVQQQFEAYNYSLGEKCRFSRQIYHTTMIHWNMFHLQFNQLFPWYKENIECHKRTHIILTESVAGAVCTVKIDVIHFVW